MVLQWVLHGKGLDELLRADEAQSVLEEHTGKNASTKKATKLKD